VASVTDSYGRILGLLERSRYFFFELVPQFYSCAEWTLFQTHNVSENLVAPGIWLCSQELWPLDGHQLLISFSDLLDKKHVYLMSSLALICFLQVRYVRLKINVNTCSIMWPVNQAWMSQKFLKNLRQSPLYYRASRMIRKLVKH
jgi:hypothetical protein